MNDDVTIPRRDAQEWAERLRWLVDRKAYGEAPQMLGDLADILDQPGLREQVLRVLDKYYGPADERRGAVAAEVVALVVARDVADEIRADDALYGERTPNRCQVCGKRSVVVTTYVNGRFTHTDTGLCVSCYEDGQHVSDEELTGSGLCVLCQIRETDDGSSFCWYCVGGPGAGLLATALPPPEDVDE